MTKKPRQKRKHRDMPDDPRLLAQAMFNAADWKMKEKRQTAEKKPATQARR